MHASSGQDSRAAEDNAGFFAENERYARQVAALETYRNIAAAIGSQITGARRLLDVGNGGVFDYDTSLAAEIVGVDLFLEADAGAGLADHITLRRGDALELPEPDAAYDRVLEVSVFHHLIGADIESTLANIHRAVGEAYRVLEPGGRFVVMESCVSARAFALERRLFGALRRLAGTRVLPHPAVLQFPPEVIAEAIRSRFGAVTVERIPAGRWIIQFGVRWPTRLTPARPYLFVAERSSSSP